VPPAPHWVGTHLCRPLADALAQQQQPATMFQDIRQSIMTVCATAARAREVVGGTGRAKDTRMMEQQEVQANRSV